MIPSPFGSTLTAASGRPSVAGRLAMILSTAWVSAIRWDATVGTAVLILTMRSDTFQRSSPTATVPLSGSPFFQARRATFDAVPVVGAVIVVAVPVLGAISPQNNAAQRSILARSPRSRGRAAVTAARRILTLMLIL